MKSLHTQTSSRELQCCVCDHETAKKEHWKKIESWEVMRCGSCGLVYLNKVSVNPEQFLDDAPENDGLEYWGYPDVFKKYPDVFRYFFEERFSRIMDANPPEGEWLDVGSGFGLWQTFVNEKGIRSHGIEIEKAAASFCVKEGLSTEHAAIETWKTDKKFSVITMCDVLEHVEEPLSVLKACFDLLVPGGVIYIQVPTVLGLRYPYNDSLGLPHHLWQFSPKHLLQLTHNAGFKDGRYWTGVQGVIRHYENGGPSVFRKSLWKLAMMTKRGNRLQVLAVKK